MGNKEWPFIPAGQVRADDPKFKVPEFRFLAAGDSIADSGTVWDLEGDEYVIRLPTPATRARWRVIDAGRVGQLKHYKRQVESALSAHPRPKTIVIDERQDIPPELQELLLEQTRQIAAVYLKHAAANQRAAKVLDVCAAFIPLRVANEEFGDLLEDFTRRINAGQHRLAYLRLVTGVLYTAVNVIGYFMQNALGRRKAG